MLLSTRVLPQQSATWPRLLFVACRLTSARMSACCTFYFDTCFLVAQVLPLRLREEPCDGDLSRPPGSAGGDPRQVCPLNPGEASALRPQPRGTESSEPQRNYSFGAWVSPQLYENMSYISICKTCVKGHMSYILYDTCVGNVLTLCWFLFTQNPTGKPDYEGNT
jgi:hypothetical protein